MPSPKTLKRLMERGSMLVGKTPYWYKSRNERVIIQDLHAGEFQGAYRVGERCEDCQFDTGYILESYLAQASFSLK